MSKFKVGDKVRCIDATGYGSLELEHGFIYEVLEIRSEGRDIKVLQDSTGFNVGRFELVEAVQSEYFTIGQNVLVAIGITRNLKRATITNVSVGKDNLGNNLVSICVEAMDVIVPEDKLFVMP